MPRNSDLEPKSGTTTRTLKIENGRTSFVDVEPVKPIAQTRAVKPSEIDAIPSTGSFRMEETYKADGNRRNGMKLDSRKVTPL